MKSWIKKSIARVPGAGAAARAIAPKWPRILMYHRFCLLEDVGGFKVHQELFRRHAKRLASDFVVWSLESYFEASLNGERLPQNLAIITVDDGYRDFYEIAFPVLLEFGLPATFFPATDFVDGRKWLWHDILTFALDKTSLEQLDIRTSSSEFCLDLRNGSLRDAAWARLCDICVRESDTGKWELLRCLLNAAEVELPVQLPVEYAPVTWDQLSEMHDNGIEIGAHTQTHPVLSRVPREALESEIAGSKQLIEERLGMQVRSFCYPNGQPADVTKSVVDAVVSAGFLGAVVTHRNPPSFERFTTSRLGIDSDSLDFLWKVDGWEYMTIARS